MNLTKLATNLITQARAAHSRLSARRRVPREYPRRAPTVELIGPYEDSGFKEPPYIVRRADGQVVQLSRLLYLLLAEADGAKDVEQLAVAVSRRFGRTLSAHDVRFLLRTKLSPAGLICSRDGATVETKRADPLLALRYRAAVVPPGVVRAASRILRPLFLPGLVGTAVSWLVVLDVWLAQHGIAGAVRQLIAKPSLLLALLALVIVSAVWHELGHATACTYGGARPGAMGVGLYVIWPAFYTDVTDAYRLRRGGRLRTDLGGVYFNALFALAAGGAYFATRFEPLLALVAVQHFQIVQQLTPLMRLDGYYVVTDLVGVPDILSRLRPLLLSFLPFRATDRRVRELKPWVRAATSTYIVLFVIAAGGLLVLVGLNAPRFVPAAAHSAVSYSHRAAVAWHRHDLTAAALAEVQVFSVSLPAVGLLLGVIRLLRRLAYRLARLVGPHLRLAIGLGLAAGVLLVGPFFLWGLRPRAQAGYANVASRRDLPHLARTLPHPRRERLDHKTVSPPRTGPSSTPAPRAPSPRPARASTTSATTASATPAQPNATPPSNSVTATTTTPTAATTTSPSTTPSSTTPTTTSTTPTTTSTTPTTTTTTTPTTTTTSTTPTTTTTTTTGATSP